MVQHEIFTKPLSTNVIIGPLTMYRWLLALASTGPAGIVQINAHLASHWDSIERRSNFCIEFRVG